jgi:hypothetical protein
MVKLTKRYIEEHLVAAHTEESWARAITEMVLKSAIAQLADGSTDEVVVDAKFRITPVDGDVRGPDGGMLMRSPCIRICVVVTPTGREVCFHRNVPI